mgnify:FL=1
MKILVLSFLLRLKSIIISLLSRRKRKKNKQTEEKEIKIAILHEKKNERAKNMNKNNVYTTIGMSNRSILRPGFFVRCLYSIDVHLTNVLMYSLLLILRLLQLQQDVENIDRISMNVVLTIEKEMDTMDYYYLYPTNVHLRFSD